LLTAQILPSPPQSKHKSDLCNTMTMVTPEEAYITSLRKRLSALTTNETSPSSALMRPRNKHRMHGRSANFCASQLRTTKAAWVTFGSKPLTESMEHVVVHGDTCKQCRFGRAASNSKVFYWLAGPSNSRCRKRRLLSLLNRANDMLPPPSLSSSRLGSTVALRECNIVGSSSTTCVSHQV